MKDFKHQRGVSALNVLFLLILAGFAFNIGFKLFTPYADHETVVSVISGVVDDPLELAKSNIEIRRNIEQRFKINQVSLPNRDALKLVQQESELNFIIDYEVRVPMFFNIDAVVVFKDEFKAIKP